MGSEQREGLRPVVQLGSDGRRQCEPIKGRGAAADFVHQYQRVRRGAVHDLRRLGHLQHEGRLRVGQVVGGADAGMNGVDRTQAAGVGRHIASHRREQDDDRDLPHIGRLAAHVRAGNDLHALARVQAGMVGDKGARAGLGQARLHHRMAAGADVDAGLVHKLRCAPSQRQRALGQRTQRVKRRQRARHPRQRRHMGLQLLQQRFVEPPFARQRTFPRAERLVLESLELGCDEAFGVFERLTASVVGWHLVHLTLGDLDIKAVHLVELHPQVGDTGACALALLQVEQKSIAVVLDRAQFVEFGVKAAGDDAAVAHQRRRLGCYRAGQQRCAARRGLQFAGELRQPWIQAVGIGCQAFRLAQRQLQREQLARAYLAQRDARRDALDVGAAFDFFAQYLPGTCAQCGDCGEPRSRRRAVAPRLEQPVAQQPAAHAGHAAVDE